MRLEEASSSGPKVVHRRRRRARSICRLWVQVWSCRSLIRAAPACTGAGAQCVTLWNRSSGPKVVHRFVWLVLQITNRRNLCFTGKNRSVDLPAS